MLKEYRICMPLSVEEVCIFWRRCSSTARLHGLTVTLCNQLATKPVDLTLVYQPKTSNVNIRGRGGVSYVTLVISVQPLFQLWRDFGCEIPVVVGPVA